MGSGSLWRHIVYREPAPGGDRHGATPVRVVRLVLSRVCMVVRLGVLVGLGISIWVSKLVAPLLYGLEPGDPVTLGFSAAVLATVGVLAGWVPAHRASRVDPADSFRDR